MDCATAAAAAAAAEEDPPAEDTLGLDELPLDLLLLWLLAEEE